MEPVKGQALLAMMRPGQFRHHIYAVPGYIVPRRDGRVVLGVTYESAGFDKRVTVSGLEQVLAATLRISDALGDCEVLHSWAGLRPKSADGRPILGRTRQLRGLLFASGHFGVGITLAPITAKLIADLLTESSENPELQEYSPDRFATAGA